MKETAVFLRHILESIERIEAVTANLTFEQFGNNSDAQDIVSRRVEIIGEAVKHIPQSLRELCPETPWKGLIGARDILIHAYFSIDAKLVWDIVAKDLPILKADIHRLLQKGS